MLGNENKKQIADGIENDRLRSLSKAFAMINNGNEHIVPNAGRIPTKEKSQNSA
jgi:hypothetical protein